MFCLQGPPCRFSGSKAWQASRNCRGRGSYSWLVADARTLEKPDTIISSIVRKSKVHEVKEKTRVGTNDGHKRNAVTPTPAPWCKHGIKKKQKTKKQKTKRKPRKDPPIPNMLGAATFKPAVRAHTYPHTQTHRRTDTHAHTHTTHNTPTSGLRERLREHSER